MIYNKTLISSNDKDLYLQNIDISFCNEKYLMWLNDKDVNRFLETRHKQWDIEKIKEFVTSVLDSEHSYLFAIMYINNHIGNIKIGPIHNIYKYADISYFIGEKNHWNKGLATESIKIIIDFGFNVLNLHRLQAGAFEENIASQKMLEKIGYQKEAVYRKKAFIYEGDNYQDCYFYGLLKNEWNK